MDQVVPELPYNAGASWLAKIHPPLPAPHRRSRRKGLGNNMAVGKMEVDSQMKFGDLTIKGRAVDVLKLLPSGLKNRQIAAQLFVTEKTVKWHISAIYRAFNVKTRAELCEALKQIGFE